MSEEKKISVSTEEGFGALLKNMEQGELKKHGDLAEMLKQEFEGINDSQCSGIIYRAHANQNAVLKKDGSDYRLLTEEEKQQVVDGLDEVQEKLSRLIEEAEKIPASRLSSYEGFKRFTDLLEHLKKGMRM